MLGNLRDEMNKMQGNEMRFQLDKGLVIICLDIGMVQHHGFQNMNGFVMVCTLMGEHALLDNKMMVFCE